MITHEIAHLYPNGSTLEWYAVHIEANPDEEWDAAISACNPGETAVHYVNGVEVDRFWNDPAFASPTYL